MQLIVVHEHVSGQLSLKQPVTASTQEQPNQKVNNYRKSQAGINRQKQGLQLVCQLAAIAGKRQNCRQEQQEDDSHEQAMAWILQISLAEVKTTNTNIADYDKP